MKQIFFFFGLITIVGYLVYLLFPRENKHLLSKREYSSDIVRETSASIKYLDDILLHLQNNFSKNNIFEDQDRLYEIGTVVNNSIRFLKENKKIEYFRSSGYDTINNYLAALQQFFLPYPQKMDVDFFDKELPP